MHVGSGPVNVGIAGGLVNALLFGARVESSSSASDYFRIVSITADVPRNAAVPEPSSILVMLVGLAAASTSSIRIYSLTARNRTVLGRSVCWAPVFSDRGNPSLSPPSTLRSCRESPTIQASLGSAGSSLSPGHKPAK